MNLKSVLNSKSCTLCKFRNYLVFLFSSNSSNFANEVGGGFNFSYILFFVSFSILFYSGESLTVTIIINISLTLCIHTYFCTSMHSYRQVTLRNRLIKATCSFGLNPYPYSKQLLNNRKNKRA